MESLKAFDWRLTWQDDEIMSYLNVTLVVHVRIYSDIERLFPISNLHEHLAVFLCRACLLTCLPVRAITWGAFCF